MISFLKTSKHFNIDPEEIWKLTIELGSFLKVSSYLASKGVLNEKNGEPLTQFILQRACWRWIIENPKRAFEILKAKEPKISDEYWSQFLVSKAYTVFVTMGHNRKKFDEWIKANGLSRYINYRRSPYFKSE